MAPSPLELFYSYSHEDQDLRDTLDEHLAELKREGVIKPWHDREIFPGQEWHGQISSHLNSANIILLLVSSAFLNSTYCNETEVKRSMERHEAGEARVIPVILRPCDWPSAWTRLQALPTDARPVTSWEDQDEAFVDIVKGIRRVAEDVRQNIIARTEILAASKSNSHLRVPDLLTDFVPRKDSAGNDIVKLLRAHLRNPGLVVLWGKGGVGKTAIAAETARALATDYSQRVVWINVESRADFKLDTLLNEMAIQLGNNKLATMAVTERGRKVQALIARKPALVVLDHFETITSADERALCTDFLQRARAAALIVSRTKVRNARTVPLPTMSSGEAQDFLRLLSQQTQVRDLLLGTLREKGAKAKATGRRLRIIQAADANPLVMQWMVNKLDNAQHLESILTDLSAGEGDAVRRVFDHTFELPELSDDARAVLLTLPFFTPGASREALAEVCGFGTDLLRLGNAVERLSNLQLIASNEERLKIEGLIARLAVARCEKEPTRQATLERFFDCFLRRGKVWLADEDFDSIEAERDNLSSAMSIGFNQGWWPTTIEIAKVLEHYIDRRIHGKWDQSSSDVVLSALGDSISELQTAGVAHYLGSICLQCGNLARAEEFHTEQLNISERMKDKKGEAWALYGLASVQEGRGNIFESQKLMKSAWNKLDPYSEFAINMKSEIKRLEIDASYNDLSDVDSGLFEQ